MDWPRLILRCPGDNSYNFANKFAVSQQAIVLGTFTPLRVVLTIAVSPLGCTTFSQISFYASLFLMIELAENILSISEQRLEIVSRNIANISTSGYKAQHSFHEQMLQISELQTLQSPTNTLELENPSEQNYLDMSSGRLTETGNMFDLAITRDGYFQVASGDTQYFTRQGRFQKDAEGRLVTSQGLSLLDSAGSEVIVGSGTVDILDDGTVIENGLPTGRIGIFLGSDALEATKDSGTLFSVAESQLEVSTEPGLRQGAYESANVDVAAEMIEMMEALRQAETGSKLVQTYDTLIGQAISTFGRTT